MQESTKVILIGSVIFLASPILAYCYVNNLLGHDLFLIITTVVCLARVYNAFEPPLKVEGLNGLLLSSYIVNIHTLGSSICSWSVAYALVPAELWTFTVMLYLIGLGGCIYSTYKNLFIFFRDTF